MGSHAVVCHGVIGHGRVHFLPSLGVKNILKILMWRGELGVLSWSPFSEGTRQDA